MDTTNLTPITAVPAAGLPTASPAIVPTAATTPVQPAVTPTAPTAVGAAPAATGKARKVRAMKNR